MSVQVAVAAAFIALGVGFIAYATTNRSSRVGYGVRVIRPRYRTITLAGWIAAPALILAGVALFVGLGHFAGVLAGIALGAGGLAALRAGTGGRA